MLTKIVDFIGTDIANGMMAGVGLILTNAAVNMVKEDHLAGGVSIAAAVLTYFSDQLQSQYAGLHDRDDISVIASSVVSAVLNKERKISLLQMTNLPVRYSHLTEMWYSALSEWSV